MSSPRMKSLQTTAEAAGGAFGFDEADFDVRYARPVRIGRIAALVLAIGGASSALAHHFGWTSLVASLGGWRAAV